MKKITKKEVYSSHLCTYILPDCIKYLLRTKTPYAYNTGVYGWNCDVYSMWCRAFTIGYRPFGCFLDRDFVMQYERRAERISNKKGIASEEMVEKIEAVLSEMMDVIIAKEEAKNNV